MRSTTFVLITALGIGAPIVGGCASGQPGVRTTGIYQYTTLSANTEEATDAAAEVLEDMELKDVQSRSTSIDGWATAKTADNTEVKVSLSRVNEKVTDVSVRVGSVGDTSLGNEIIARIEKELGIDRVSSAR